MKFPLDQIQEIQLSPISNSVWTLAGPNINTIIERLQKYNDTEYYNKQPYTIQLYFEYSFFREIPLNKETILKHIELILFDKAKKIEEKKLIDTILSNLVNCTKTPIIMEKFYNPVRLLII